MFAAIITIIFYTNSLNGLKIIKTKLFFIILFIHIIGALMIILLIFFFLTFLVQLSFILFESESFVNWGFAHFLIIR